jgi:hypothetical protein
MISPARCTHSHDEERLVTSCVYEAKCKQGHFGIGVLAKELLPKVEKVAPDAVMSALEVRQQIMEACGILMYQ